MSYVIAFDDERGTDGAAVGGKGANLGLLAAAGFAVPPGFTVSTDAYVAFLNATDVGQRILASAGELDYARADELERQTAEIRRSIEATELPANVVSEIARAYEGLGSDAYVAVRSSGTAEDTATASFAGLHDTFLDVRGADAVAEAVRRCWASMWTARASAYRSEQGFAHADALIAVVVQAMISSEVSGVMFTANPLSGRTDEIVINASWGLGEGVVSGILTPDEATLDIDTLRVKELVLGAKEVQVVRAPGGSGTVTEPVAPDRQAAFTLDEERLAELAQLGRDVADHYGGMPQDIEWAYAGELFHVLQARPVTGVELTWDDHLDDFQDLPESDDTTWTLKWSDEFWTGAISPLFYTVRGKEFLGILRRFNSLCGLDEFNSMRYFKYRRGTAYYNADVDRVFFNSILPASLRAGALGYLPDSWKADVLAQPLDVRACLRMLLRVGVLQPHKRGDRWHASLRSFMERVEEADGPRDEALRAHSDAQVRQQLQRSEDLAEGLMDEIWAGIFIPTQWAMGLFGLMLAKWYDGDNAFVLQDLISGLGARTLMTDESHGMWRLADRIRSSSGLRAVFEGHAGAGFFTAVAGTEEGDAFLADYAAYVHDHGHRGQADRDIYFTRRSEDPGLDYESLRAHLAVDDPVPPWEGEERVAQKRRRVAGEVEEVFARQTLGGLKAQAFRAVYAHVIDFLLLREDWRHYVDRITMTKKRCFKELGRRAAERGLLEDPEEVYFLGQDELFRLLDGGAPTPLLRAKIDGRRRAFHAFRTGAEKPPLYLVGGTPTELDLAAAGVDGALQGMGTAQGESTGRARVVPDLAQIGRVENGDILICYGTDPGWAAVFGLVRGLVMEAGGMLAHGSCLSREYGIPAVVLRGATGTISDGATITVNGGTGVVRVEEPAAVAST